MEEAIDIEMQTLLERGTWKLIEPPPAKKPVGVKWVFEVMTNADGSTHKYKVRRVATGLAQIERADLFQIFDPVSDYTSP